MSQAKAVPSPDLGRCEKPIIAIAKYLRHNTVTKHRAAFLAKERYDMFKPKRAVRALLDPGYENARKRNQVLPEIKDEQAAYSILEKLGEEKFIFPVVKLETEDALAKGLKPVSGVPCVLMAQGITVKDSTYAIWLYNPIPLKTYLYGVGLVLAGIAVALFQLWPMWARILAMWASYVCMGLVGAILAITVVRTILVLISMVILPQKFWLFPNLYADLGFLESFRPVWSWGDEKTLPPKPKIKKRKSKATGSGNAAATSAASAAAAASGAGRPGGPLGGGPLGGGPLGGGPGGPQPMLVRQTPNGPVPVGPLPRGVVPAGPDKPGQFVMHPVLQQLIGKAAQLTDMRLAEIVKSQGPKSEDEIKQMRDRIFKEEIAKLQKEIQEDPMVKAAQAAQAAQKS